MLLIIAGIFFIVIGVIFITSKKSPLPITKTDKPSTQTKDITAQDEKNKAKLIQRQKPLEELIAPSNFPEVVFYFGSQTGTAEKFCGVLEQEAQNIQGIKSAKVIDFEEFKPEIFTKHPLVIIQIATHYEGDPCDNTKKFYKWMREVRKTKDTTLLKGMKFAVFGLGDSSYEQYNFMSKYVNEALEELGAERIYKYGEGNAEGNHTEDDFNNWKLDLWDELIKYYTSKQTNEEKQITTQREVYQEEHKQENKKKAVEFPLIVEIVQGDYQQPADTQYEMAAKQYQLAKDLPIKSIVQLRQNLEEGSTFEVTYDLRGSGMSYKTATNLAVFPENSSQDIEQAAKRLGYSLDSSVVFKNNPNSNKKGVVKHPFPTPITIREALKRFVDLRGPLRKKVLKDLSAFCQDESEKQRLVNLSNAKEEFVNEIEKKMLGLIDILEQYPSLQLPMEAFFQISDRIMPRYYTIASSNLMYPDEVKIAVSLEVTTFDTPVKHEKWGQVSRYIQEINENVKDFNISRVTNRIFIKESQFDMPKDHSQTPIIMVGPGTGVVPFIGFLQERSMLKARDGIDLAAAHLYFGCRKFNSDFIYQQEIEAYEKDQIVTKVHLALSREIGQPKMYVQDLMRQNIDQLKEILGEKNGNLYICGSTKMGHDVQSLLKEVFGEDGFKLLEKEKRLIKELWG